MREEVLGELLFLEFGFLEAEDIGGLGLEDVVEVFFQESSKAIDVPAEEGSGHNGVVEGIIL